MTELLQKHASGKNSGLRQGISQCVQCGYCSACCEFSFISMDTPRKVIRFLQRNNLEKAVISPFLMLCKQCQTCSLMCPQGIDVAKVMRRLVRNRFLTY